MIAAGSTKCAGNSTNLAMEKGKDYLNPFGYDAA
jgi:hypothetical protein